MTRRRLGALIAVAGAVLLLAAAGCDALPDGEPPDGPLTDNRQPPVTSPRALRNHLVTQLIMFALERGVTSIDPGSDPATVAIAAEAAQTAGFRLDRAAPLAIKLEHGADGAAALVAAQKSAPGELWRSRRP